MSGSVPGGGVKAEPNLTPILDMVFQLITFFMLVINFKSAELDLSLQLPVIGSAKPLRTGAHEIPRAQREDRAPPARTPAATPMPRCSPTSTSRPRESWATSWRARTGMETVYPYPQGAIPKGKTCLSVCGRLLTKESRSKDIPSIDDYLKSEAEVSMTEAKPPLTRDEVVNEDKELPDIVVIRADAGCRFGAVNYIVTECQDQGYRKFALKTMHDEAPNNMKKAHGPTKT